MRIAVARELDGAEPRVAATAETVKKLKSFGADVVVARGAGIAAGIPDAEFAAAGAEIGEGVEKTADVVLKVRRPAPNELAGYKKARWSSPSWIRTATRPRSSRWPRPGSQRLPWS